jgi:tetratricopeptide (TPR) repeat protein
LGRLGDLAYRRQDFESARARCQEALALWRSVGDSAGVAQELATLGRVALAIGDAEGAAHSFRESLARAREAGSGLEAPLAVAGLAMVASSRGEIEHSVSLFAAAEALGEIANVPMGALYPGEHDESVAQLRTTWNDNAFLAAWSEGRKLTLARIWAAELKVPDSDEHKRLVAG